MAEAGAGSTGSSRDWAVSWPEFDAAFRTDVELWASRSAGEDLLADDGPTRPLRPATLHHIRGQVRIAASALVRAGVPIGDISSLEDIVTVEAVRTCVRWLIARSNGSTRTIHHMVVTLRSVARHYVKLPEAELDKLGEICRRLAVPQRGLTKKNRDQLRPFNDQHLMDSLLLLPHDLMRRARSRRRKRCAAARDAQVAVALEIQLMAALRSANLANLQLGKHILINSARPDRVMLAIDEHETKNESIIDQELPPESARLLRRYIDIYLPVLESAGGCYLFPGRSGDAIQPAALGKRITAAIRAATGCEVNPHLLRHLGAKRHLERHPGEYGVIQRVLTHKSANTTAVYTGMESAAAVRHFDAGLLADRRAAEARIGRGRARL